MNTTTLTRIRYEISSRVLRDGARFIQRNPKILTVALASTAIFSAIPEGVITNTILGGGLAILGNVGVNALYDFTKSFIDRLADGEQHSYRKEEVQARFEEALLYQWREGEEDPNNLEQDLGRFLQAVQGINAALDSVSKDLRKPLIDVLIELGATFDAFRWILIEQRGLLLEIKQQSVQLIADVKHLRTQVARLQKSQADLPGKLKLLLLYQSERVNELISPAPIAPIPTHSADIYNPYKGLPAFQKSDSAYFFGREELVAELLHQLTQEMRFLAVIGPSGSGKSSLVQAGLLAALESETAHRLIGSRDWLIARMRPGEQPIEQLATAVSSLNLEMGSRYLRRELEDDYKALARAGGTLLSKRAAHARLLVVVDQFEELFTRCRDHALQQLFIQSLIHASEHPNRRIIVIITLRADFYGYCTSHERLRTYVQEQQLLVGPLLESELRRVIELPALQDGLQIEPGLTEIIIKDVSGEPGALPLLSQALLETWRRREGNLLTRHGYIASGGVHEAISRTANQVFTNLTPTEQEEARRLFLRLVELGENSTYDSRRRTPLQELITATTIEARTDVQTVLDTFIQARLVTADANTVEIAHEALIREWQTLQEWLETDRDGQKLHRYITEIAYLWNHDREAGDLLREGRLARVRAWMQEHPFVLNEIEQAFVDASIAVETQNLENALFQERSLREIEQKRAAAEVEARQQAEARVVVERRSSNRLRWFSAGISMLLLLACGLAGIATVSWNRTATAEAQAQSEAERALTAEALAESEAERAFIERDRADSLRVATEARAILQSEGGNYETAGLLALWSLNQYRNPPAQDVLQQALREIPNTIAKRFDQDVEALHPHSESVLVSEGDFESETRTYSFINMTTGEETILFTLPTSQRGDSAFSEDGRFLVVGDSGSGFHVWNMESEELTTILKDTHDYTELFIRFSEDNQFVLISELGGNKFLVFDLENNQILWQQEVNDLVTAGDISSHLRLVAIGGYRSGLQILDISTGAVIRQFENDILTTARFSPVAGIIATTTFNSGVIELRDVKTGERIRSLTGHTSYVETLEFSADGSRLLSGGGAPDSDLNRDFTVRLWEVERGTLLKTYTGHTESVQQLQFQPESGKILSLSLIEQVVRIWQEVDTQKSTILEGDGFVIQTVLSPDERYIAVASMILDIPLSLIVAEGMAGEASTLDFEDILQYYGGTVVRVYDLRENVVVQQWHDPMLIPFLQFTNNGTLMGAGADINAPDVVMLIVWNLESGVELRRAPIEERILDISSDGQRMIVQNNLQEISLIDTDTFNSVAPLLNTIPPIATIGFSEDNRYVLYSARRTSTLTPESPNIQIWDAETGVSVSSFIHESVQGNVMLSPDNHYLVAVGNNQIAVWDAMEGTHLNTITDTRFVSLTNIVFLHHQNSVIVAGTNSWFDSEDVAARQYALPSLEVEQTFTQFYLSDHTRFFVSPDDALLVGETEFGDIDRWNIETAEQITDRLTGRMLSSSSRPMGVEIPLEIFPPRIFSNDSELLFLQSSNGITIYDAREGQVVDLVGVGLLVGEQVSAYFADSLNQLIVIYNVLDLTNDKVRWQVESQTVGYVGWMELACETIPRRLNREEENRYSIAADTPCTYNTESPEQTINRLFADDRISTSYGNMKEQLDVVRLDLTNLDNQARWQTTIRSYDDFVLSAQVTWGAGNATDDCGFVFGSVDTENLHAYTFDQQGEIVFQKLSGGFWDLPELRDGIQLNLNMGEGATNHVIFYRNGSYIEAYINDTFAGGLYSDVDDPVPSGNVGFFAQTFEDSENTSCTFSDIWIWQPD